MACDRTVADRLAALELQVTDIQAVEDDVKRLKERVLSLQRENIDIKRDLLDVSKEKEELQENLVDLEARVCGLEEKLPRMEGVEEFLQSNNKSISSKLKKLERVKGRVSAVEGDTRALKTNVSSLVAKTAVVEGEVQRLSGLQRVLNRAVVATHGSPGVDQKIDHLDQRTKAMEDRMGDRTKSVTRVEVDTSDGRLDTGRFIKLDKCRRVYINGGLFDQTSGCVVPHTDGDFVVGARWRQYKDGVIRVWLEGDGDVVGVGGCLGRTVCAWDVGCGVTVRRLKKGQKVWLEARRVKGEADIGWCELFCWLL